MIYDLEYNSERTGLIIPEYGRHIQKLVDHCIDLKDPKEREKMAQGIVEIMANLQSKSKDVANFKEKLWDQLFIMSKFELDVASPYEKLTFEKNSKKPKKLDYPEQINRYRFYGKNIQRIIDVVTNWEEGEHKQKFIFRIANQMKKFYLMWNKDNVEDELIFSHLYELSDNKIDLRRNDEKLTETSVLLWKTNSTKNFSQYNENSNVRNGKFRKKQKGNNKNYQKN